MEGLIQCPRCNKKYKTSHTLKKHVQQIHNENVDEIDVIECKRVPTKKGAVKKPYHYVPRKRKDPSPPLQDEAHQLRLETERKCALIVERARTNPDECSICMTSPAGGAAVIPCGHATFCYACLQEWGPEKGCPMCRGYVQIIQKLKI